MDGWDDAYGFVIVGSGAGSVPAALIAKQQGKRALIIEKSEKFGGSSALSGGVLWIPNSPVMERQGSPDSYEQARAYLDACAGDVGSASSPERRHAFLTEGPRMMSFLEEHGMAFTYSDGWADYHETEYPGGLARGRSHEAKIFDLRELGRHADTLLRNLNFQIPVTVPEAAQITLNGKTWRSKRTMLQVGWRMVQNRLGRKLVRRGGALQGRLLQIALKNGLPFWTDCPVIDFVTEAGGVTGVVVRRNGTTQRIRATDGVLINSGGFSHNARMRTQYQPHPASADWTFANPGDTGEVIETMAALGAATDLMDLAWWIPSSRRPDGAVVSHNPMDMAKPHCLMVDSAGNRYVNEATSYVAAGIAMFERHRKVPAVPSWMIIESRHRNTYRLGGHVPGEPPKEWITSGYMKRAVTIEDLAQQCGIEPGALKATVTRFNGFARDGLDQDFGKGRSAYHRFMGDPSHHPNPCLGPVEKPPFYAIRIFPGDVGTAGGLLTDEFARVLRGDGSPIPGLYATGNATASVVGRSYPGAGASIGASMVFGYIAARHALGQNA